MEDDVSRRAVDVAERYADGVARAAELTSVRRAFGPRSSPSTPATEAAEAAKAVVHRQAWEAAQHAALYACSAAGMVRGVREEYSAGFGAERDEQTALFRDIVGPLGEPAPLGRPLMTADVVGLARGIDADLAFDRLPILADALMDAGCEDEHILAHCRSEGPHVRGCWVVDSIIGEE